MAERRSRFEELYRQQTQSGQGTFSALGSAARERARERADLRRLFPNTGMLGAMLESTFGKAYKSGQKGGKAGAMSGGASPLDDKALNVIRMNTAIMAKNSMVLPGMARDMNVMRQNIARMTKATTGTAATRADTHFLKAKERESAYESAISKGSADKKSAVGKVSGGASSLFKSIFGGIGSFLGGTLALGGSIISSLVSGLGSVLGIVGGVAGGILGAIGSAVSGLGIMGIIALAGAGYMISQMNKSGMFDDLSLGKMFGLAPRADGKGLFEDTAKKLDTYFKTDKFTETLQAIKGNFAGLAAASMKVFSNLSDMVMNFLNLALQELKIVFVDMTNKFGGIAGGVIGAKKGFDVGAFAAGSAMTALNIATMGKGGAVKGVAKAIFTGAGLTIGGTAIGGALGYYGGKSISENIEEFAGSGDINNRQKSLLEVINTDPVVKDAFEKYVQVRRAQAAGVNAAWTFDSEVLGMSSKYTAKSNQEAIDFLNKTIGDKATGKKPKLEDLEKEFGIAFGAPITTDETFSMLAMKQKRKHLQGLFENNRDITSGVADAFNETKELYTGPSKVTSSTSTMPTKFKDSDMANLIRNRFIAAGFTPEQAEAAVVNAFAESSLNPLARATTSKEDSVGLFMANRKGGLGQGYSVEQLQDPNFNIDLAIKQAKKSEAFGKAGTVSEAIAAFVRDVERPANMEEQISKRIAMANEPLENAVDKNTEELNRLNKFNEQEKESTMTEILTALLQGMASATTGATVNNVNNTTVASGPVASPYNEDMMNIFKQRVTQGF
jgi:hypothetical protein